MSYLNNSLWPGSCVMEVSEVDALAVAALVVAAEINFTHNKLSDYSITKSDRFFLEEVLNNRETHNMAHFSAKNQLKNGLAYWIIRDKISYW